MKYKNMELDWLLVTLVPLSTEESFNEWFENEAGKKGKERDSLLAWTTDLHRPVKRIKREPKKRWSYPDDKARLSKLWESPEHKGRVSYYHSRMHYEMRTKKNKKNNFGNQACYGPLDSNSTTKIITTGICSAPG